MSNIYRLSKDEKLIVYLKNASEEDITQVRKLLNTFDDTRVIIAANDVKFIILPKNVSVEVVGDKKEIFKDVI